MRKPLWIRLGAPWNLAATIGSRPVTAALPSRTGDLLATPSDQAPNTAIQRRRQQQTPAGITGCDHAGKTKRIDVPLALSHIDRLARRDGGKHFGAVTEFWRPLFAGAQSV
jgi:hypothetical protein